MNVKILEAVVEMVNRRQNNIYIVVKYSCRKDRFAIVNTTLKEIMSPQQAVINALEFIARIPKERLLELLKAKCILDDTLKADLELIWNVLSGNTSTPIAN